MSKGKKEVHQVRMTDGKRKIIAQLLEEYDIKDVHDIQEALKDLLGGTIEEMLECEMNNYLTYPKYARSSSENTRNGYKQKEIKSSLGTMKINVPQDRQSTFDPKRECAEISAHSLCTPCKVYYRDYLMKMFYFKNKYFFYSS